MSGFTTASEYEKAFEPQMYLSEYFNLGSGSLADDYLKFVLGHMHKTFTSVKHVCDLEGNGVMGGGVPSDGKLKEKEEMLRGKIKQVLMCDISKSNPLESAVVPKADCLTATVCLKAACKNDEAYGPALRNLSSILKPNGCLLLAGGLGASYYQVGPNTVFSLSVNEEFLKKVLTESGYIIKKLEVFWKPEGANFDTSDYEGFYFLHAQKS
ncbi:hypothetical protein FKM82_013949 [Ascaphus truei]